jgi:hypothetical protein
VATRHSARTRERQPDADSVIARTAGRLTGMFDLRGCRFEPFPFDTQLPRIEPGRIVLPGEEPGLEPWSADNGIELPIRFRGLPVGRFVLLPKDRTVGVALQPSRRFEAIALAADLGVTIAARIQRAD